MPNTGAPWYIPYVAGTDLVADWPTDSQELADAIADGLDEAGNAGIGSNVSVDTETATFSASVATAAETSAVLSASITPTSTSSQVLVQVHLHGAADISGFRSALVFAVRRGGTLVGVGDAASNRARMSGGHIGNANDNNAMASASVAFVDSPASTSSLTYTVHLFNFTGSTQTFYLNRTVDDSDSAARPRVISSLILTEVAA